RTHSSMTLSSSYKKAAARTAIAQVIVFLLAGLMLDGGFFARITLVAGVAYWARFIFVVVRHPKLPTRGDLVWASAGFAISLALTFAVGPVAVLLRGH
ncbi:MAG TPA: hypothetical protein VMZ27_00620, partial [Candidatus Saccharimonadales bacterium]|nr:hypothetical protein [Candidatus Saccharimonadales bacterium]